ncbi:MAG: sigma-54-dependent Fis family transcriptional regulator [Armatimonadetes bacterium]|nr:sigma-54-dependent Fis family transcriptional regulator [Armatimonadota bacterium]
MPTDDIRLDGVRILLVDDEAHLLQTVRRILTRHGAEVETALNGRLADELHDTFLPDVVVTDLKMPEMDGVELLRRLSERPAPPLVIILTGHATVETAIEAMRHGARDYLLKPCDMDELLLVLRREVETHAMRLENRRLRAEVATLQRRLESHEHYGEMVGGSPAMREVYRQVERLCQFHDIPVLITGETGTGKELVARALHHGSPRAPHPFIAINCGAIPTDLQESQLFGHRKGAFTGATEHYIGAFEAAHQGTLLLDEIGEMRPEMQVKLLRALEEKAVTPLGRNTPTPVDVRVVAATNRDLAAAVAEGSFRADLYNRIEGVVIHLPPLRERIEDLPLLAGHVLARIAEEYGILPKPLTAGAMQRLRSHRWPGNVRELQNVLRRAFLFAQGEAIEADDLTFGTSPPPVAEVPQPESEANGRLDEQERRMIEAALREAGGNKSRAAAALGIDRKKLYRRLRRYGMG